MDTKRLVRKPPKLDLFPVVVTSPNKEYQLARVWIQDNQMWVWIQEGSEVRLAETAIPLSGYQYPPHRRHPHIFITEDGEEWSVVRSGNCGCGSPLKGIKPWTVLQN